MPGLGVRMPLGSNQRRCTEFNAGARYRRDDAVRRALGESVDDARESVAHDRPTGLLREREANVARLVAGGLTNKQISAQLLISERTSRATSAAL